MQLRENVAECSGNRLAAKRRAHLFSWLVVLLILAPEIAISQTLESGAAASSEEAGTTIPLQASSLAEPGSAATQPEVKNRVIEEIVVTAQKREENIQDVPISIQAFSGDALGARGVENTQDLGLVVPSLQFTSAAGFSLVFIRGLGSDNFIPSADPSIATYIDGIYIPNGADTKNSLGNIKRVEVLKGPQGTLFGRNATGGAISVTTDEPGNKFLISAEGEAGNLVDRSAKLAVSGPITRWLSASVSGVYSRKNSDYSDINYATEPDKIAAGRVKLNLHPLENLSLSLTAYYSNQQGLGSAIGKNTNPSLVGQAAGIQPEKDDYQAQSDVHVTTKAQQTIDYGILSWKLKPFDIKLLASYEHLVTPQSNIDFDGSPEPLAAFDGRHIFTDLQSGELQVISNDTTWGSDRFKWVAGLYYLQDSAGVDPAFIQASPAVFAGLLGLAQQPQFSQLGENLTQLSDGLGLQDSPLGTNGLSLAFRGILATRSYSTYAQGTYYFTDWVDLTLGGRFQHERRYLTKSETDVENPNGGSEERAIQFPLQSADATNFSPKAVLSLHPADHALVYASYAIGFKSGTFNIVNIYTPSPYVVPEKVTTYELGAKLELLDRRLRINGAIFDNEIDHLQSGFVSLFSGGAVQFISVPSARSRGADFDYTLVPFRGLDPGFAFTGNAAYVDAKYTDFPSCPGFQKGTQIYSASLNCTGNRIVRTPKISGGVGAVQTVDVSHGTFELAVDEYYNAGFWYDAYNTVKESPYALLNAHFGYLHTPWNLRATLFGQNVLDRRYHLTQFQTDFGVIKTLAAPREYGVRLNWGF